MHISKITAFQIFLFVALACACSASDADNTMMAKLVSQNAQANEKLVVALQENNETNKKILAKLDSLAEAKTKNPTLESLSDHWFVFVPSIAILIGVISFCVYHVLCALGLKSLLMAQAKKKDTDDYERILSNVKGTKREDLAYNWLVLWHAEQGTAEAQDLMKLTRDIHQNNMTHSAKLDEIVRLLQHKEGQASLPEKQSDTSQTK